MGMDKSDSWKGLYESTLKHVKEGTIPMSRLDDAVRRILRVKIASGIFTKGAPSTRKNAGNAKLLGLPENRAIARQAVRESMVLLKNNNKTLPIDASKTILVVGDGAESISKACGGWTLSWQGKGHTNEEFPNGESILDGIKEAVRKGGGKVIYSKDTNANVTADVVIAIYGEDPYAEFQGDRENLDFVPNDFDVNQLKEFKKKGTPVNVNPNNFNADQLKEFKKKGIPIVSVFLSGRPLWTNPEINNSDAFVAAWLPGSEGGGISDMLFQRDPSFDFTGRLSFEWPAEAVVTENSKALFKLGYGLTYKASEEMSQLPEISGLENSVVKSTGEFYSKGAPVAPWGLWLHSDDLKKQIASYPTSVGGLIISKTDHQAQEDALRIKWTKPDYDIMTISASDVSDMSRQSNGAMELAFTAKSFKDKNAVVKISMCEKDSSCTGTLDINIESNEWKEYRISLSCFDKLGVDMSKIISAFMITANEGVEIGLSNIHIASDLDGKPGCDGN